MTWKALQQNEPDRPSPTLAKPHEERMFAWLVAGNNITDSSASYSCLL
jgi:hypothetical protein